MRVCYNGGRIGHVTCATRIDAKLPPFSARTSVISQLEIDCVHGVFHFSWTNCKRGSDVCCRTTPTRVSCQPDNSTVDDNRALEAIAQRMRVTLLSMLLGFSVNWVLCVGLIWHLRTNRAGALKGDAVAARKVILPAFEPVLIVLSVVNGAHMVFLLVTQLAGSFEKSVPPVVIDALYSGNKFMALFVLVVLFQKSISFPAVKRSVVILLVLAYYCMPYMYLALKYGRPDQQKALLAAVPLVRCLHLIPFVYAFINPPTPCYEANDPRVLRSCDRALRVHSGGCPAGQEPENCFCGALRPVRIAHHDRIVSAGCVARAES
jgi:hypothetical protein